MAITDTLFRREFLVKKILNSYTSLDTERISKLMGLTLVQTESILDDLEKIGKVKKVHIGNKIRWISRRSTEETRGKK